MCVCLSWMCNLVELLPGVCKALGLIPGVAREKFIVVNFVLYDALLVIMCRVISIHYYYRYNLRTWKTRNYSIHGGHNKMF